MDFLSGLMWGAGFSLGCCVGLLAWSWLRAPGYRRMEDSQFEYNVASLEALLQMNRLTVTMINALLPLAEIRDRLDWMENTEVDEDERERRIKRVDQILP